MKKFIWFVLCSLLPRTLCASPSFLYSVNIDAAGSGGKCEWKLYEPADKTERVLLTLPHSCPEAYMFDPGEQNLYYINDQNLIAANWEAGEKRQTWPLPSEATPAEGNSMSLPQVWKDETTHKIRFAFVDRNVTIVKKKVDPDEEPVIVWYKGQNVGEAPQLGEIGAAVVYELTADKWKVVEIDATNDGACDTLGLSGISINPAKGTFGSAKGDNNTRFCSDDKDASASAFKFITAKAETESMMWCYTTKANWALINTEVGEGGPERPGFPAFLFSPTNNKLIPLLEVPSEGGLDTAASKNGEWFSILTDASPKVRIYSYNDPKPIKVIDKANWIWGVFWLEDVNWKGPVAAHSENIGTKTFGGGERVDTTLLVKPLAAYSFEEANYWGNEIETIPGMVDPQECAGRCDKNTECKVASFHGPRATGGWANTCVLRGAAGERHTEQVGIISWVKPSSNRLSGEKTVRETPRTTSRLASFIQGLRLYSSYGERQIVPPFEYDNNMAVFAFGGGEILFEHKIKITALAGISEDQIKVEARTFVTLMLCDEGPRHWLPADAWKDKAKWIELKNEGGLIYSIPWPAQVFPLEKTEVYGSFLKSGGPRWANMLPLEYRPKGASMELAPGGPQEPVVDPETVIIRVSGRIEKDWQILLQIRVDNPAGHT